MNKTVRIILIIAGALMVCGGIFITIGGLFGGSLRYGFTFGNPPVQYTELNCVNKSIEIADFSSLYVDTASVDVEIVNGDEPMLEVYAPEEFFPEVSQDGKSLSIHQPSLNWQFGVMVKGGEPYYRITVPTSDVLPTDVTTASGNLRISGVNIEGNVSTTSGEIMIEDVTSDDLEIQTTSGNGELSNFTLSNFKYFSTSGDVSMNNINTPELEYSSTSGILNASNCKIDYFSIQSTSGDCFLEDLTTQKIETDTTSGNITLNNIKTGSLSSISSSGDINADKFEVENILINVSSSNINLLMNGDENDYDYIIDTQSGNIDIGSISTDHKYHSVDNKQNVIQIDTTSGDINLSFQ